MKSRILHGSLAEAQKRIFIAAQSFTMISAVAQPTLRKTARVRNPNFQVDFTVTGSTRDLLNHLTTTFQHVVLSHSVCLIWNSSRIFLSFFFLSSIELWQCGKRLHGKKDTNKSLKEKQSSFRNLYQGWKIYNQTRLLIDLNFLERKISREIDLYVSCSRRINSWRFYGKLIWSYRRECLTWSIYG